MGEDFCDRLNFVLEQSYSLFSRVEQNTLMRSKRFNLSISELHLIEVINKNPIRGRLIGDIAGELMITPSSVTIAVNKLVKKGYAVKKKVWRTEGRCTCSSRMRGATQTGFTSGSIRALQKASPPDDTAGKRDFARLY